MYYYNKKIDKFKSFILLSLLCFCNIIFKYYYAMFTSFFYQCLYVIYQTVLIISFLRWLNLLIKKKLVNLENLFSFCYYIIILFSCAFRFFSTTFVCNSLNSSNYKFSKIFLSINKKKSNKFRLYSFLSNLFLLLSLLFGLFLVLILLFSLLFDLLFGL